MGHLVNYGKKVFLLNMFTVSQNEMKQIYI